MIQTRHWKMHPATALACYSDFFKRLRAVLRNMVSGFGEQNKIERQQTCKSVNERSRNDQAYYKACSGNFLFRGNWQRLPVLKKRWTFFVLSAFLQQWNERRANVSIMRSAIYQ